MYTEKRQHPRKLFTVAVTLDFNGEIIRGFECRNISQGGMFVAVGETISIGKEGLIALTVKCGDDFITFESLFRVVGIYSYGSAPHEKGIGIKFTGMSDDALRNLQSIITCC